MAIVIFEISAFVLDQKKRGQYFGVHMFNPPSSMTLCEVTPTPYTNRRLLEECKRREFREAVQVCKRLGIIATDAQEENLPTKLTGWFITIQEVFGSESGHEDRL